MLVVAGGAAGQQAWTPAQGEVLAAIEAFSATTAPGGAGADAYAAYLADDFSRWTLGSSVVSDKASWVDGVRDWFTDGWRVADREVETVEVEVEVRGDLALTRRVVREVYRGPDGARSSSRAALAEIWRRQDGRWLLWRADVHALDGD